MESHFSYLDMMIRTYKRKKMAEAARAVARVSGATSEEIKKVFFDVAESEAEYEEQIHRRLQALEIEKDDFTILLSHRPELYEEYGKIDADLVLTGHAHGGQIRIDGIGGIYAPTQGLFPKYTEGVFVEGDMHMVVSRVLGNSGFPYIINNPPEIVIIDIQQCKRALLTIKWLKMLVFLERKNDILDKNANIFAKTKQIHKETNYEKEKLCVFTYVNNRIFNGRMQ